MRGAGFRGGRPDWIHYRGSEYLAGYPRALLVRVTPKMAEGLWAKVARGAAMTQGMSLPPMKRAKASFLRMRAFCGDTELTPIPRCGHLAFSYAALGEAIEATRSRRS